MAEEFFFMLTQFLLRYYQDFKWSFERLPATISLRPSESAILRKHVTAEAPVILDVGANLGASVSYYKAVFPRSRIYALEPDPITFAKLKRRHGRNPDVTLINAGAGENVERRTLHRNSLSSVNSLYELDTESEWVNKTPGMKTLDSAEVELISLDELAADLKIERVDFIKCDTQGFEPEVLRGARRLLSEKRVGVLKLEASPGRFYTRVVPLHELESILEPFGYELLTIGSVVYGPDATLRYLDAYFAPKRA